MNANAEIIALLLDEGSDGGFNAGKPTAGAKRLVRDANGRVTLEAVASQEEFDQAVRNTGCFRRSTPILDPETREVIGYEMEEVPLFRAAARSRAC